MLCVVLVLFVAAASVVHGGVILEHSGAGDRVHCKRGTWAGGPVSGWRMTAGNADRVLVFAVGAGGFGCLGPDEGRRLVYAGPGDLSYGPGSAARLVPGGGYVIEFRGPSDAVVRVTLEAEAGAADAPWEPLLHASIIRAGRTWAAKALLSPACAVRGEVVAGRLLSADPPRHQLLLDGATVLDSRTAGFAEWRPVVARDGGKFFSACALAENTVLGVTVCPECVRETCASFLLARIPAGDPVPEGVVCVGRPQCEQ